MNTKKKKNAKVVLDRKSASQGQALLQIDPLPKKRGTLKAQRNILINPRIYPMSVVETAVRLIDPRDFEVSWDPEQSVGHIRVHISAMGYEYDAEELEYYFYRKLILASATHYSQQMHSEIRTLFMQTAHNVTRQTWQALGWDDAVTAPIVEAKEAEAAPEAPQLDEYKSVSYVVDEAQKLHMTVKTATYALPDILSVASDMRRAGWSIEVDARTIPIHAVVKLKNDDVKAVVTQFHDRLESTEIRNSKPAMSEKIQNNSILHTHPDQTLDHKVDVDVHPQIFSLPTIQLAALLVLDRLHIKIEGDPEKRIVVNLKSKSTVELSQVESVFYEALIQASLDEYRLAYYESVRAYFLKLALSFGAVLENASLASFFQGQKPNRQKLDYRISVSGSEIRLNVSGRKSAQIPLFDVAWRLKSKGVFVFEPEGADEICLKIRPKPNIQIEVLRKILDHELQRNHVSLPL